MPRQDLDPIVRVKPHSYQPSKAEREAPIRVNATPDQIAKPPSRRSASLKTRTPDLAVRHFDI